MPNDLNFNVILNGDTTELEQKVDKTFDKIDKRADEFVNNFQALPKNEKNPGDYDYFLETLNAVQSANRSAPQWMQNSGVSNFYMRDMAQLATAANAFITNLYKMSSAMGKGADTSAKAFNATLSASTNVNNLLKSLKAYEGLEKQIGSLSVYGNGKNIPQLTSIAGRALDTSHRLNPRTVEESDVASIIASSSIFRSGVNELNGGKAYADKTYREIAESLVPFVGGRYYVRPTNEREMLLGKRYKDVSSKIYATDDIYDAFGKIVAARGINPRINTKIKPELDADYADAFYAIQRLAMNGNATALSLGQEARIVAPINGSMGHYDNVTKNNLRYFGGLFAQELHDIKTGSVQYPKDFMSSTVEGSTRYNELMEIQNALLPLAGQSFSTSPRLREEVYSQQQELVSYLTQISKKGKGQKIDTPITEPGRMEMFAIPRTTFDKNGKLIYIDPTNKDGKGGYALEKGYRKYAYDTRPEDRSLSVNYSQLARDFGIRETGINGSYGYGRNEKGEFIIPDRAPIVAVRADDILEKNREGFLGPRAQATNTEKAKWLANAVNTSAFFGPEGKEQEYVFAGVSGGHVLFGLKDVAEERNQERIAKGLLPKYGPEAAQLILGSSDKETFKALSNTKRRNTEVVSRDKLGYAGGEKIGTIDLAGLHTIAGLLSGKKLSEIDEKEIIDGAGIAVPSASSTSFQVRGAGEMFKGVFSSFDPLSFLLRSVVPNSEEVDDVRRAGMIQLARLAYNGKSGNQLFTTNQQGELNGVYVPSLAFRNLADGAKGTQKQKEIISNLINGKYSEEEAKQIRDTYFTNMYDQLSGSNPDGYGFYVTEKMIKGNDNDRQMPVERYEKLFPGALQQAKQEGRVNKGIVNLNTSEIEKKIAAEVEDGGGWWVERTTDQFRSDKDYIPLTVARAMNLGEEFYKQSAANYQERRAQLNSRSYIRAHGLGNAKFDRQLTENPGYIDTPEAQKIIQSELNALEASEAAGKLLIPGSNTSLLAQPIIGAWFKDYLSINGIDPEAINNEYAPFYNLGQNVIFAPARKERRMIGTRFPTTPDSTVVLNNIGADEKNVRLARRVNADMSQAAVSPNVIYKMNTGDFDGDTIALYAGFSDAAYDATESFNSDLEAARQKYHEKVQRLVEGQSKINPQTKSKNKTITTLGDAVVQNFYNHEKAQEYMGTYSGIIQKAFERGGNTQEALDAINLGAEYYDLATSQMMNEGLEVQMPEFLNQYNQQKRLFDRFTREVGEELNGGEPHFKGIFAHGLKSMDSPLTLQETRFAGIARKNGFGANFLESDIQNWVDRHYGDEIPEVLEAARFMGDVMAGQVSGSKLYTKQELIDKLTAYSKSIGEHLTNGNHTGADAVQFQRNVQYKEEIDKFIADIEKNADHYLLRDTLETRINGMSDNDPLKKTLEDIRDHQGDQAETKVNEEIMKSIREKQRELSAERAIQKQILEAENLSEAMRIIKPTQRASVAFTAAESYIPKSEVRALKGVKRIDLATGKETEVKPEDTITNDFGNVLYQRQREKEELIGRENIPTRFSTALGSLMHAAFEETTKDIAKNNGVYKSGMYKSTLEDLITGKRQSDSMPDFAKLEKDTGISIGTLRGLLANGFNFNDEKVAGANLIKKEDQNKLRSLFGIDDKTGISAGDTLLDNIFNLRKGRLVMAENTIYGPNGKKVTHNERAKLGDTGRQAYFKPDMIFATKNENGQEVFNILDFKSKDTGALTSLHQSYAYIKELEDFARAYHEDKDLRYEKYAQFGRMEGEGTNRHFVSSFEGGKVIGADVFNKALFEQGYSEEDVKAVWNSYLKGVIAKTAVNKGGNIEALKELAASGEFREQARAVLQAQQQLSDAHSLNEEKAEINKMEEGEDKARRLDEYNARREYLMRRYDADKAKQEELTKSIYGEASRYRTVGRKPYNRFERYANDLDSLSDEALVAMLAETEGYELAQNEVLDISGDRFKLKDKLAEVVRTAAQADPEDAIAKLTNMVTGRKGSSAMQSINSINSMINSALGSIEALKGGDNNEKGDQLVEFEKTDLGKIRYDENGRRIVKRWLTEEDKGIMENKESTADEKEAERRRAQRAKENERLYNEQQPKIDELEKLRTDAIQQVWDSEQEIWNAELESLTGKKMNTQELLDKKFSEEEKDIRNYIKGARLEAKQIQARLDEGKYDQNGNWIATIADDSQRAIMEAVMNNLNANAQAAEDFLNGEGFQNKKDEATKSAAEKLKLIEKTPEEKAEEWKKERLALLQNTKALEDARSRLLDAELNPQSTLYERQAAEAAYKKEEEAAKEKARDVSATSAQIERQAAEMAARETRQQNRELDSFKRSISGERLSKEAQREERVQDLKEEAQKRRDRYATGSKMWNEWNNLIDKSDWDRVNERLEEEQKERDEYQQLRRDTSYNQLQRQIRAGNRNPYGLNRDFVSRVFDLKDRRVSSLQQQRERIGQQILERQQIMRDNKGNENSAEYKKAASDLGTLTEQARATDEQIQQMRGGMGTASAIAATFGDSIGRLAQRFGHRMFMRATQEAKRFVQEFDRSMTSIQMITLKSDSQMSTLGDGLIAKAKELKVSISEISQSAEALYRQGLSDQEVEDRLGIISKFSKVSGTKVDAATKLITVAMNTGLVDSPETAADIVTALGDSAATNAAEIERGIEKAGAAAAADGTTFAQLASMLTAITSTTQIGGNVAGRTLNTIFARMNKIGTNELIYDENGHTISGSDVAKLLKQQGIDTYKDGKKRSSYDVLFDLSQKWEGMSDAEQQQIATAIAGTRMYSNFAAIMQGMSEGDVAKYMSLAGNAEGITDKKFEIYTKSLQASLTNLKNTYDELIKDWTNSGFLTGAIDVFSTMIKGVDNLSNSITGLGASLITVIPLLAGLMMMRTALTSGNIYLGLAGLATAGVAAATMYAAGSQKSASERLAESNEIYQKRIEPYQKLDRLKELRENNNRTSEEDFEYITLINSFAKSLGLANSSAEGATYGVDALSEALKGLGKGADEAADRVINEAEEEKKQAVIDRLITNYSDFITTAETNADKNKRGMERGNFTTTPGAVGHAFIFENGQYSPISEEEFNHPWDKWYDRFSEEALWNLSEAFLNAEAMGYVKHRPTSYKWTADDWYNQIIDGRAGINYEQYLGLIRYMNKAYDGQRYFESDVGSKILASKTLLNDLLSETGLYTPDQIDFLANEMAKKWTETGDTNEAVRFITGENTEKMFEHIDQMLEEKYVPPEEPTEPTPETISASKNAYYVDKAGNFVAPANVENKKQEIKKAQEEKIEAQRRLKLNEIYDAQQNLNASALAFDLDHEYQKTQRLEQQKDDILRLSEQQKNLRTRAETFSSRIHKTKTYDDYLDENMDTIVNEPDIFSYGRNFDENGKLKTDSEIYKNAEDIYRREVLGIDYSSTNDPRGLSALHSFYNNHPKRFELLSEDEQLPYFVEAGYIGPSSDELTQSQRAAINKKHRLKMEDIEPDSEIYQKAEDIYRKEVLGIDYSSANDPRDLGRLHTDYYYSPKRFDRIPEDERLPYLARAGYVSPDELIDRVLAHNKEMASRADRNIQLKKQRAQDIAFANGWLDKNGNFKSTAQAAAAAKQADEELQKEGAYEEVSIIGKSAFASDESIRAQIESGELSIDEIFETLNNAVQTKIDDLNETADALSSEADQQTSDHRSSKEAVRKLQKAKDLVVSHTIDTLNKEAENLNQEAEKLKTSDTEGSTDTDLTEVANNFVVAGQKYSRPDGWKTKNEAGFAADTITRQLLSMSEEGAGGLQTFMRAVNADTELASAWEVLTNIPEVQRIYNQATYNTETGEFNAPDDIIAQLLHVAQKNSLSYAYGLNAREKAAIANEAYVGLTNQDWYISGEVKQALIDSEYNKYANGFANQNEALGQEAWIKAGGAKDIISKGAVSPEQEEYLKAIVGDQMYRRLIESRSPEGRELSNEESAYMSMMLSNAMLGRTQMSNSQRLAGIKDVQNAISKGTFKSYSRELADTYLSQWSDWGDYAALLSKENLTNEEQKQKAAYEQSLATYVQDLQIDIDVQGIDDLEKAGKVAEGTREAIEKLRKGGKFAIEATVSIENKAYTAGQRRANLYNGTNVEQDEAAMEILGISRDQYYASRDRYLERAKQIEQGDRETLLASLEQDYANAKTDADRQAIDIAAEAAGFGRRPRQAKLHGVKGDSGRYIDDGTPGQTTAHPLIGQRRFYTDAEKNVALDQILSGSMIRNDENKDLYDAAVDSAGTYTRELLRRQENGENPEDWLTIASENERASYRLSQINDFSAQALRAQTAQYAYQNYDESMANSISAFTGFSEEEIKRIMSTGTDEDKNLIKEKIKDQQKAMLSSLSETFNLNLDFSDMSTLKDQIQTKAGELGGLLGNYLQWVADNLDDAGQFIPSSGNKTFKATIESELKASTETKAAMAEVGTLINSEDRDYASLLTNDKVVWSSLNKDLLYMLNSRANGSTTFTDEMIDETYANALYGRKSSPANQRIILSNLFGNNLSAQSMVNQYKTWMGDPTTYAAEISTLESLDGIEKLTEAMGSQENAVGKTATALEEYNDQVDVDQINYLNKFGERTADVAAKFGNLRKSTKSATAELKSMTASMSAAANNQFYRNAWQTGDRSSKTKENIASQLGLSNKKDLDIFTDEQITARLKNLEISDVEDIQIDADAVSQSMTKSINDALQGEPLVLKGAPITVDSGPVNLSFDEALNELGSLLSQEQTAFIQMLQQYHIEGQVVVTDTGKGLETHIVVSGMGDGVKSGGGGGGGGGKSKVDKLLEAQKRRIASIEHENTMLEIQAGDAARNNLNEEYIRLIEAQIAGQTKLRDAYKKNIEELNAQLKTLKEESDDWYKVKDAITAAEEAIAQYSAKVDELASKRLQESTERYEYESGLSSHEITILDVRNRRNRRLNDYSAMRENIAQRASESEAQLLLNTQQLRTLRMELARQIYEGKGDSDYAHELTEQINQLVEASMTLDEDIFDLASEVLELNNLMKENAMITPSHYANVYETQGNVARRNRNWGQAAAIYDKTEENYIEQQQILRDSIARNREELEKTVQGTATWYSLLEAIYTDEESLLSLTVQQMDLEIQRIDDVRNAYDELLSHIQHSENMALGQFEIDSFVNDYSAMFTDLAQYSALLQARDEVLISELNELRSRLNDPDITPEIAAEVTSSIEQIEEQRLEVAQSLNETWSKRLSAITEKQQNELAPLEHQAEMIEFDEQRYTRLNDYDAYIESLQKDDEIHRDIIATLEDQQNELIAEQALTTEGTDAWFDYEQQIMDVNKRLEENTKKIDENNKKKLEALKIHQQNQDREGNHTLDILSVSAERSQMLEDDTAWEEIMVSRLETMRDEIEQNQDQLAEAEALLAEYTEGSEEWLQARDYIWSIKRDTAQKENEALKIEQQIDAQRLAEIQKANTRSTAFDNYNLGMMDVASNVYQTFGNYENYRAALEKQYKSYDNIRKATLASRDAVLQQMETLERGTSAWYNARDAVYAYDKAVAGATNSMLEKQIAIESANIQELTAAYNDAQIEVNATLSMIRTQRQRADAANDFEQYQKLGLEEKRVLDQQIEDKKAYVENMKNLLRETTEGTSNWYNLRSSIAQSLTEIISMQAESENLERQQEQSKVDHMLERMSYEDSNREHNLSLIQYEQTRYQNAGELTNYGIMLEKEIELRQQAIVANEKNIAELKAEQATLQEGSKEYNRITEEIKKKEEAIASDTVTIEKNKKMLEENRIEIIKTRQAVEDATDKELKAREEQRKKMLKSEVDLQKTLLDTIKDLYKKQWELEKQDIEKKKEALEKEKSLINERLNARKDAMETEEKYRELEELQRQLALISNDPTRTRDAKELRERISEIEQDLSWEKAYAEADNVTQSIDDEIQAMSDYVSTQDENLNAMLEDANNFAEQIAQLMSGEWDELAAFLMENNAEFKNSLDEAQQQMLEGWEQTWKDMKGIVDVYWPEINEILDSYESFINFMKDSVDYVYASPAGQLIMEHDWEELYDKYQSSTLTSEEAENYDFHDHPWMEGSLQSTLADILSGGFDWLSWGKPRPTIAEDGTLLDVNDYDVGVDQRDHIVGLSDIDPYDYYHGIGHQEDGSQYEGGTSYSQPIQVGDATMEVGPLIIPDFNPEDYVEAHPDYTVMGGEEFRTGWQDEDMPKYTPPEPEEAEVEEDQKQHGDGKGSGYMYGFVATVVGKTYRSEPKYSSLKTANAAGQRWTEDYYQWYLQHYDVDPGKTTKPLYEPDVKTYQKRYIEGGYVDYTGPAWVDGSPTRPEAFLDAEDTALIRYLADALSYVSIPQSYWPNTADFGTTNNSYGNISIVINQAELKDDADFELVARKVGKAFTKELSRRGYNLTGYNL